MQEHTLIANSGIQIITFPLRINTQEKFKMWYHEWYDTENGEWRLDPVYELRTDDECYYYNKQKLHKGGYLSDPTIEIDVNELKSDDILPLRIEDENCPGVRGDIFSLTFSDKDNKFSKFENAWLPVPYFFKRTLKRFKFGPLNWVRMKLIPTREEKGIKWYNVVLAFDTRARYESDEYEECPVFPDAFRSEMDFELCSNEFYLMDYCSPNNNWSYIDDYLLHLVHPNVQRVSQLRGANVRKMSYIASYIFLINYLAQKDLFPKVKLYKDTDVEIKDVDMVVDIGNSRTTALLIEDNTNFNQVRQLELIDYTNLVKEVNNSLVINKHNEPFDMRLAFRKVDFGSFGIKDSKQFVHPSLVRLGQEANTLIHLATNTADDMESLSTYSSPKRYLWDWRPNKEEWKFLVLKGEKDDHILNLRGITNQLKSDGSIDLSGESGSSYHYSRRSLMTFSFLEMLVQARIQINSVGDWYPFGENTGYIKNAKTIVAMGGVIGHYASELSNLNKFIINLDLLKKNLKSTVNYIEASREGQPIEYFITPDKYRGDLTISSIPQSLHVRQIGMDSYPSRALYSIDFNRHKMADKIRKKAIINDEDCPTDAKVIGLVNEAIDVLKKRMPFKITIERDMDDKENLSISAITDKNGNDIMDGNLEIHIQSLGVDEQYWLDSGAFDF